MAQDHDESGPAAGFPEAATFAAQLVPLCQQAVEGAGTAAAMVTLACVAGRMIDAGRPTRLASRTGCPSSTECWATRRATASRSRSWARRVRIKQRNPARHWSRHGTRRTYPMPGGRHLQARDTKVVPERHPVPSDLLLGLDQRHLARAYRFVSRILDLILGVSAEVAILGLIVPLLWPEV